MKRLLLFISITLMLGSCKPTENTGSIKKHSSAYLLKQLDLNSIDYNWFTAKIKVNFQSPEERFAATMNVRIQKDSMVWISGSKFTVEGVRILMTQDSIYMMDRLARKYTVSDYAYLQKVYNLPASLEAVQAILVGNTVIIGNKKQLRADIKGSQYTLTATEKDLRATYTLDGLTYLLDKLQLNEVTKKRDMIMQYSDYQPIESKNKNFSYFRNLTLQSPETGTITSEFRYSRVTFDIPKNTPFKIPSSYQRIEN